MAEGARLESVYTFTGIGGSNPSLSAITSDEHHARRKKQPLFHHPTHEALDYVVAGISAIGQQSLGSLPHT